MLKFTFPIDKGNQSDGFIHFYKVPNYYYANFHREYKKLRV